MMAEDATAPASVGEIEAAIRRVDVACQCYGYALDEVSTEHGKRCDAERMAALADLRAKVDVEHSRGAAACRTLGAMGYTWEGGALWRPPIGKRPVFADEAPALSAGVRMAVANLVAAAGEAPTWQPEHEDHRQAYAKFEAALADHEATITAHVDAAVLAERGRFEAILRDIGDFAHGHSTGPAVEDDLWEVRRMAYDALDSRPAEPQSAGPARVVTVSPVEASLIAKFRANFPATADIWFGGKTIVTPATAPRQGEADDRSDAARYRHLRDHCSIHYPMTWEQPAEWSIGWEFQQGTPAEAYGTFDTLIDKDIERLQRLDEEGATAPNPASTPSDPSKVGDVEVKGDITVPYTNWEGRFAIRTIRPTGHMMWASNRWHTTPQWLIEAQDAESGGTRLFALSGFGYPKPAFQPMDSADKSGARVLLLVKEWNGLTPMIVVGRWDSAYVHAWVSVPLPNQVGQLLNPLGWMPQPEPIAPT